MTGPRHAHLAAKAERLCATGRALVEHSRALRQESLALRERAHDLARRYHLKAPDTLDASEVLLDGLATAITNLRSLPRGSDARLALLDQLGDLVMRLQLADLGFSEVDAQALLHAVWLDQPLKTLPRVES